MPTPGYIALQFNATYLGDYRICWRLNSPGPYTCFTVNCGSIGLCTAYITPISFATNLCDTDNYNGYIQAACEDPNTLDGAVMWDVDYATLQACQPWQFTCLGTTTTTSSFNIEITAAGSLAFVTGNIFSNNPECICNDLTPVFSRGNSAWNSDLSISPWVSNDLTKINAWDLTTQAAGQYHWPPGSAFCGRFEGCWTPQNGSPANISPDFCTDPNATIQDIGPYCMIKPIITISNPPPGGTLATAEAVLGMGGIKPGTPIAIINAGSGGTPGTYYTWNIQPSSTAGTNCLIPKGKNYFKVVVGSAGTVTLIEPCNNINCDSSQPKVYGYAFNTSNQNIEFNPASIGNCTNVLGRTPSGNFTDIFQLLEVVITNPGSGYTSVPVVTISTPACNGNAYPGITIPNFTVTSGSVTGPCPSFIPNQACGTYPNNAYPTVPSMPIGTEFNICYPQNTVPPAQTGWDIEKDNDGCCYECVNISVNTTNSNPNPKIVYTTCDGIIKVETVPSSPYPVNCVVVDSWASDASDTTFLTISPC